MRSDAGRWEIDQDAAVLLRPAQVLPGAPVECLLAARRCSQTALLIGNLSGKRVGSCLARY